MKNMSNKPKPCLLAILDGWGIEATGEGNAVTSARTPFLDGLADRYPVTTLHCHGPAVGLPPGIMGNSEVGHLNIGAGRRVNQDLLRIDQAIQNGSFFDNPELLALMDDVARGNATLHLMGLVSDGGVHSQLSHLMAIVEMAKKRGLGRVFVHAILDGRDTPPESGARYLGKLQEYMNELGFGAVATVCGRFFAMDRDKRWDRIEKAFQLYTEGLGTGAKDAVDAVENAYRKGETDEFVKPIVMVGADGLPLARVDDGDGIFFFNFRADRAREITRAFVDPDFDGFARLRQPPLSGYVTMTVYDEELSLPAAFPPVSMNQILGEVMADNDLRQLRIAETEKYAHVTYFFNGGEEHPFPLEERCLIPSPRDVATYDLKPEMSAFPLTEELLKRIDSGVYDLIVVNFANMDMVGHTGIIPAAVKACGVVDQCVEKVVSRVLEKGGVALVTADHGNAEKMVADDGNPHTAHTLNPVPFIMVDDTRRNGNLRPDGVLADIAPTILDLLGINQPTEMTGESLISG
jgi:2,3-bisphosphoglycerate-independent phosphoglycerate mutase